MSLTTTSAAGAVLLAGLPQGLLINGAWRAAVGGEDFAVDDPATGRVLCRVADAGPDDARAAIDAAAHAQEGWAATSVRKRADILWAAHDAVRAARDDAALLISLEMGKPLVEARAEVDYGADFLRWFAEEAMRIEGLHAAHPDGTGRVITQRQPIGPCLLITPWNFPLAMVTRKLGASLAAGCTVILKPAELTPLTALLIARLVQNAGLPDGVLNVLTTTKPANVTSAVLGDGRLRKLSFTGSTEVGRHLNARCAERLIRTSLELGGNAALIVCVDADLDRAVEGALVAKLRNGGASCVAANRLYVHRSLREAFAHRLAARMAELRIGRGTDDVELGPLINAGEREKVAWLVDDAVARGATVLTGGHTVGNAGWFFAPTVLTDVPPNAAVTTTEIFGPVAPIHVFDDDEEAILAANATPYGLAAYLFTQDVDRAFRMADRIASGMVAINQGLVSNAAAPFGGVKASGLGREGGHEGLDAYLETKYLALSGPPASVAMNAGS